MLLFYFFLIYSCAYAHASIPTYIHTYKCTEKYTYTYYTYLYL